MNEGLGKGKKADAGPPLKFDFVVPHEANPNPSPNPDPDPDPNPNP